MDHIDKKILMILQENGKISNVALAKEIGLTPPATLERVRKLEEASYIKGYKAILNGKKLDRGLSCLITITLKQHAQKNLHIIEDQLKNLEEVEHIYFVTGRFYYVIKVNLKDIDELRCFMVDRLTNIDLIDRAESLVILASDVERGIKI